MPVVFLPPGRKIYVCRFTAHGKRFTRSTGTGDPERAEAEAIRLHAEAQLRCITAPRRAVAASKGSPLDVLSAAYLEHVHATRSEWTLRMQTVHWRAHFLDRWKAIAEITPAAIDHYKVERTREKAKPPTIYKELVTLSRFFKWAKRHGHIDHVPDFERVNPASDYKAPDLTADQMRRLLAELPDRARHPKHYPVREYFTVLWAQGMRAGELQSLTWADIDLERERLTVRASRDKARKGRTIALARESVAVLSEMAKRKPLSASRVFGSFDLRVSLQLAAERAKLPPICQHHLRHARLSELAGSTRDMAAVQYFAGHMSLTTTDRYVQSRTERTEELLRGLNSGDAQRGSSQKGKGKERAVR